MWKRLLPIVLLSTALLLSGCITLELQNIINADGSGEKVMITAMDQETYDMMVSSTPAEGEEAQDPFESIWEQCEQVPEATCEEYVDEDAGLVGVRVSVPFDSLDELVGLSENPIFDGSDEISFEQSGGSTTMHITVHTKNVGNEVAGGSGEMAETPEPEATLTPEQQEQMEQLLEMMEVAFYYRVTAPASVTDYGPQENAEYDEETNTVSWEIDLMSEEPAQELWVSWGGVAVEVEPTARPTAEAGGQELPEPTSPAGRTTPKPCSCLPGLALPVLGLGAVLVARRRRSI